MGTLPMKKYGEKRCSSILGMSRIFESELRIECEDLELNIDFSVLNYKNFRMIQFSSIYFVPEIHIWLYSLQIYRVFQELYNGAACSS
jgi:hypothetical protein